jgi:hypothetical protein
MERRHEDGFRGPAQSFEYGLAAGLDLRTGDVIHHDVGDRDKSDDVYGHCPGVEQHAQEPDGDETCAGQVEAPGNRALGEPRSDKPVMEVIHVRARNSGPRGFFAAFQEPCHGPPPDRQDGVEQRHADGQERHADRREGGALRSRAQRYGGHREADGQAPAIAEETARRVKVVAQESKA